MPTKTTKTTRRTKSRKPAAELPQDPASATTQLLEAEAANIEAVTRSLVGAAVTRGTLLGIADHLERMKVSMDQVEAASLPTITPIELQQIEVR